MNAPVAVTANGRTCVIHLLPAGGAGGREQGRADVQAVLAEARRPLTRKEVLRHLRASGRPHGPGTVAKALAELTTSGLLSNPKDKRGYRLAEWVRPHPSLFGGLEVRSSRLGPG